MHNYVHEISNSIFEPQSESSTNSLYQLTLHLTQEKKYCSEHQKSSGFFGGSENEISLNYLLKFEALIYQSQ